MIHLVANTNNIVDAYLIQEKFLKYKPEILYKNYTRLVDKKIRIEKVYLTAITIGDNDAI